MSEYDLKNLETSLVLLGENADLRRKLGTALLANAHLEIKVKELQGLQNVAAWMGGLQVITSEYVPEGTIFVNKKDFLAAKEVKIERR